MQHEAPFGIGQGGFLRWARLAAPGPDDRYPFGLAMAGGTGSRYCAEPTWCNFLCNNWPRQGATGALCTARSHKKVLLTPSQAKGNHAPSLTVNLPADAYGGSNPSRPTD